MRFVKHLKIGRVSSFLSVAVATGLLINAILSNHGGTANSQAEWRAAAKAQKTIENIDMDRFASTDEQSGSEVWIDTSVMTGSVEPAPDPEKKPIPKVSEPSVLSLIRENSDLAPGVSSGTNRVSVTVKTGDTLFGISQRHGISVADLARLNDLSEPYTIRTGQTLYIAR